MAKKIGTSLLVAFGMFSRIPLPTVEWNKNTLRYALCAFPLVGLAQGLFVLAWGGFLQLITVPTLLTALVLTVIPYAVNGGIHFDGLADTADALASHDDREKKLAILKDPHIGAFGVLTLLFHVLATFVLFCILQITWQNIAALTGIYVLSRALSGWAVVRWPTAKTDGTAHVFQKDSAGTKASVILGTLVLVASAGILACTWLMGLFVILVAMLVLLVYRRMALKQFGGVTGDLAGWFLQTAELAMIAALVIGGLIS